MDSQSNADTVGLAFRMGDMQHFLGDRWSSLTAQFGRIHRSQKDSLYRKRRLRCYENLRANISLQSFPSTPGEVEYTHYIGMWEKVVAGPALAPMTKFPSLGGIRNLEARFDLWMHVPESLHLSLVSLAYGNFLSPFAEGRGARLQTYRRQGDSADADSSTLPKINIDSAG